RHPTQPLAALNDLPSGIEHTRLRLLKIVRHNRSLGIRTAEQDQRRQQVHRRESGLAALLGTRIHLLRIQQPTVATQLEAVLQERPPPPASVAPAPRAATPQTPPQQTARARPATCDPSPR